MADAVTRMAVAGLASPDSATADAAVDDLMRIGVRAVPALMGLKGATGVYRGTRILNPMSSMLLPVPAPGFAIPESERDRVITVEAAALYLISALYHRDLHFARAPLLLDEMQPRLAQRPANSPERLARAWDATARWLSENAAEIAAGSRAGPPPPLEGTGLRWF